MLSDETTTEDLKTSAYSYYTVLLLLSLGVLGFFLALVWFFGWP